MMEKEFDQLVAVSGLPGLYKMVANRSNGLIIEDLDEGKRRFAPSRKHQFTPLASIGIYTDDGETRELGAVFRSMRDKMEETPPPALDENPESLRTYLSIVLPDYDRDKVYVSDIKKLIKWFTFLNERNLIPEEKVEDNKGAEEEE